jgi:hypothetical protein
MQATAARQLAHNRPMRFNSGGVRIWTYRKSSVLGLLRGLSLGSDRGNHRGRVQTQGNGCPIHCRVPPRSTTFDNLKTKKRRQKTRPNPICRPSKILSQHAHATSVGPAPIPTRICTDPKECEKWVSRTFRDFPGLTASAPSKQSSADLE